MANLRFCCDNIDKAQEVIAPKRRRLTNDGGCAPLKRRRGRGGEGYYVLPPTKRPALTGDVVLKATDGGTKIDASVVAAAPPPPQNVLLPPLSRRESIARTVWISHLLWTVVLPTAYPDEFRHLRRVAALVPKKTEEKVSERPAGPRTHFDLVRRWNPPVFLVTERPRPRQPITPFLVLGFHPVEERPLPPRVMTSAMTSLECLENWEWLAHEDAGREASRARGMATEAVIEREKTAYLAGPDPWTFDCVGRHLTGGGLADPESPSGWLRTVAHAAEAFFPLATLGAVTLVRTDGHRTAAFGSIEVGCPRLAAALFAGINLNDGHTDARFAPPSALGWRLIEESDADGGGRMVSVNAVLRSTWRCAFAGHFSSAEWLLSRVRIFAAPRTADMISAVRLCFELACRRGDMACAAWLERTFHFDEFSMQRTPGSALLDGEHAKLIGYVAAAGSPLFLAWITKTFAIGAECMRPRSDNDALPKMTMLTPKARPDTRQVSGMIETNEENALSRACVAGRFDNAEWLLSELCGLKTVVPPAHDVRGVPTLDHVVRVVRDAFVDCAARGQRGNAEWLAERLGLCHANFARHATWALAAACGTGRLALAQWICAKFSLGGTDVRARGYLAFLKACKHGHVDIAKWFADKFGFAPQQSLPAQKTKCVMAAIEIASDAGDFSVLGWLVSRFAFSTELKTVATVFPAFQSSHGVQRILTWAKIS